VTRIHTSRRCRARATRRPRILAAVLQAPVRKGETRGWTDRRREEEEEEEEEEDSKTLTQADTGPRT